MNLTIRRLQPCIELKECIKDIWVFESNGGLSEEEMQIIVPNGSAKLMLYYKGHLRGQIGNHDFLIPEHRLFVLGVSDCPTTAGFDRDRAFGCICIELHPAFAYRVLVVPQHELRNTLMPFGELVGTSANNIMEERMYMTSDPVKKALLLQEYLIKVLARTGKDAKFEYGVSAIWNSHGLISIAGLSHDTGHSDRWIRAKFSERLGISPKTFASIVRFQFGFQALLQNKHGLPHGIQFNDFYYDQSHFIKEFKRFIGHPPAKYAALQNEVGEIIYFK